MGNSAESTRITPLKAAIYVRVSTEEQARRGVSLGAQEEALTNYCKTYNFELFQIYKDEGKSAKDIAHRPALRQLLADAEAKKFNIVLVYKLDRFSRSLIDLKLTVEKLKKLKVEFVSLQEKIETNSAAGNLFFNILGSFAEFERQIIGERTKFGMAKKARDGTVVNRAPLGYDIVNKKLVLLEKEVQLVSKIFEDFKWTNLSLNKFAEKYGITTRGIIKLLRNRTYLGEIGFAGEWNKGEHPLIINQETFDWAQSKLDSLTKKFKIITQITPEEVDVLLTGCDNRYADPENAALLAVFINDGAINLVRRGIGYIKPPAKEDLEKIREPQKQEKYIALQLFKKEKVEFMNFEQKFPGGRPDIIGKRGGETIIVECGPCRIDKPISFLEEPNAILWHTTNYQNEGAFVNIFTRGPNWARGQKFLDERRKEMLEETRKFTDKMLDGAELKKIKSPLDSL